MKLSKSVTTSTTNPTIGVTGASGFIGKRVVEICLERGLQVVAFVRPPSIYPQEWVGKVIFVEGDISNAEDASRFVELSDIIIHMAAVVTDWAKKEAYQKITIDGTRHLLEAMIGTEKKMVLASSIAVYSRLISQGACTENLILPEPIGNYSWSKQEQERLVRHYGNTHDIDYTIVRPGNVFGPYSQPWVHEYVVAMKKGPILIGSGEQKALCYIDNVAEVFILAALSDQANGQVYNATDDNEITWKEYAGFIAKILVRKAPSSISLKMALRLASVLQFIYKLLGISSRPALTEEAISMVAHDFDIPYTKAKKELGYRPLVGKEEALEKLKEYLIQKYKSH